MNTSDFVTCPGSKSGYAAKIKAKHLRELHLETVQLELENQEMEEKLIQLRRSMSREKEERERSNGCHWKSGQAASVSNQTQARIQNKENSGKASSGRIRLKIFRDHVQETVKQSVISKTSKPAMGERPKGKGKACGQCETKSALLVCLECGEDYCTFCYARFHQKGALKLHRTIPFQTKSQMSIGKLDVAHQFKKDVNPCKSAVKPEPKKEINKHPFSRNSSSSVLDQSVGTETVSSVSPRTESRNESGGLLLNGVFDETESAGSFKEILMDWRKENEGHKERENSQESEPEENPGKGPLSADKENVGNSEVQTILTLVKKTVDIDFKENGLTYLEKLLLKKHRRTSVGPMPTMHHQVEFKCSHSLMDESQYEMNEEEDGLTAEEIEAHEQYAALFKTEESDKDPERQESSLKIVILDDVCEHDLEESRIFTVDETECSDSDIDQRNGPLTENQTSTLWLEEKSEYTPIQPNDNAYQFPPPSTSIFEIEDLSPGSLDKITTSLEVIADECTGHSLEERWSRDMLCLDRAASADSLTGLQRIALRDKKSSTSKYLGLERFFIIGLDPGHAVPSSVHSQNSTLSLKKNEISLAGPAPLSERTEASRSWACADDEGSAPTNIRLPLSAFARDEEWRPNSSLSENADDLIVQHILLDSVKRSSESLGPQNLNKRVAVLSSVHKTSVGYSHPRCLSANPGRRSSISFLSPRPKTAVPRPLSRAASEISEIEYIDVTQPDNSLFDEADQQTLTGLEKELNILNIHADSQKNLYSLTAGDLSGHNRCLKNKSETTEVNERPGDKDHIIAIAARSSDEECEREKYEILWDKESVKSLQ
ncbi:zinc finger B-box domain-containing protein 1 isoform X2 [Microcaecilia unicolor]|uniref:Zinc finger B-box domain-containing protein 1 isoform X2 n=1 Tax=Microcaecilia unicolor TaxID=1415580 RepID=A0A6P7ZC55_9AMPH|nr:zinc finger B-box domain-containing protein 1 isoform X2 [Microcaecilia unicolor]